MSGNECTEQVYLHIFLFFTNGFLVPLKVPLVSGELINALKENVQVPLAQCGQIGPFTCTFSRNLYTAKLCASSTCSVIERHSRKRAHTSLTTHSAVYCVVCA